MGVTHDQLPIASGLTTEDLDGLVMNRDRLPRVIDRYAFKVGV